MKTVTPFTHDDGEVSELKPRGRPRAAVTKVAISLRLPPEVLARWKATGPGWQTRMADALARAIT